MRLFTGALREREREREGDDDNAGSTISRLNDDVS